MDENILEVLAKQIYVKHMIGEKVFDSLSTYAQYGRSDTFLCVIGPTGTGKTRTTLRLESFLCERLNAGWEPNRAKPVVIEAPCQVNNKFPWRSFLEELLLLLGDNCFKYKFDFDTVTELRRKGQNPGNNSRLTIGQLERLVRTRINVLKPIVLVIDEAQNFVDQVSENDKKENVNRLKYWANTMDTKFILFGTHEAEGILDLNEQLSRRVTSIYFPRYRKTKEDLEYYASFYKGLVESLNIKMDEKINNDFLFIYNHTLGCPGMLVSWIHDCISYCLDKGVDQVTLGIWRKHRASRDRLTTMEKAIKNFEAFYDAAQEAFNPDEVIADPYQYDMDFSRPTKSRNTRPGKSSPRRYPVHDD
ncbi:conserved hypothetical protein [Teredinibacter turnerae T7901]|uniref:AAA+ ATPase domain-containing protein n=1 Tax=Teredinibacter turnerae (strain ATCC 39867 / T7901) TaxID=377629 RepID=C5BUJ6_TERTT|nr:ATP-binding protein [Teredinibacter turnerae]ACR13541.1 conserved hypothetical protein [Teredinibacter turnerae T7901]